MPLHNFPDYKVVRNVRDYGAKTDGSDCSKAFKAAMTQGNRCGSGCNSTSTKGAVIFIPGGTYVIKSPIIMYYYTAIIGDANDPPIIKGSSDFSGIALIDTNVYYKNRATPEGDGINWYVDPLELRRRVFLKQPIIGM
jgi:glucan 1,3-beta-glucosidase